MKFDLVSHGSICDRKRSGRENEVTENVSQRPVWETRPWISWKVLLLYLLKKNYCSQKIGTMLSSINDKFSMLGRYNHTTIWILQITTSKRIWHNIERTAENYPFSLHTLVINHFLRITKYILVTLFVIFEWNNYSCIL